MTTTNENIGESKQPTKAIQKTITDKENYFDLTPKQRVMDALLYSEQLKTNITISKIVYYSNVTRPTVERIVALFIDEGILELNEKIGNSQLYSFDIHNKHVRRWKEFSDSYIREEMVKKEEKELT